MRLHSPIGTGHAFQSDYETHSLITPCGRGTPRTTPLHQNGYRYDGDAGVVTGVAHVVPDDVNRVLRDHRSGDFYPMDPDLLDTLYLLQQSVGVSGAFHIISGYRSPSTNEKLRASGGGGVAKRSLHMQGKAVDIRLPGCGLKDLRNAALELKAGGVGYYAKSNFIHVDTGRVRRW